MNYISTNEIKLFIDEINKFDLKNKSNLTTEEKEFIKLCIDIINSNRANTIIKKDDFKNKTIEIKNKFKYEYDLVNKKTDDIFNEKIQDVKVEKDDFQISHHPSSYSKKKHNIITRIFISLGSLLKSIFCFGNKKSLADKKIIRVSQSTPVNKVDPVIIKTIIDTPLLNSSKPIEASQFAWHLNLGLMRSAYESTNDPQLKEQIQFMATNYLDKTAPIRPKQTRKVVPEFDSIFQTGPFSDNDSYHRLAFTEKMKYSTSINKKLGLGEKSPLILTDTEEFQSLFPLNFRVMNEQQKENELGKELSSIFLSHLNNFKNEPLKGMRKQLDLGLMFDLTDMLKSYIHTDADKKKEDEFELKFNEFKKKLNQSIDHAVDVVAKAYPDFFKKDSEKKEN